MSTNVNEKLFQSDYLLHLNVNDFKSRRKTNKKKLAKPDVLRNVFFKLGNISFYL